MEYIYFDLQMSCMIQIKAAVFLNVKTLQVHVLKGSRKTAAMTRMLKAKLISLQEFIFYRLYSTSSQNGRIL